MYRQTSGTRARRSLSFQLSASVSRAKPSCVLFMPSHINAHLYQLYEHQFTASFQQQQTTKLELMGSAFILQYEPFRCTSGLNSPYISPALLLEDTRDRRYTWRSSSQTAPLVSTATRDCFVSIRL